MAGWQRGPGAGLIAHQSCHHRAAALKTVVVYVHGLWFSGYEAVLLRPRLAHALDAELRVFAYHSVTETITANAAALGQYLATIRCDTLHLVGHSMGGVIIFNLFQKPVELAPGRILLLGSPLQGSEAARALARLPFGDAMLGRGIAEQVLNAPSRHWDGARDLGIIAGSASFGLGHLVKRFDAPNDGTVFVEETRLDGARDHLVLPVTHAGLLLSPEVARQGAEFLLRGRFAR
ncbi:MAG: esterase/lipase family protein [Steroidobacterales bacterium]